MLNHARAGKTGNAGFSLIELMVAMVLGLIVIGSVIALVLSMMRANNQTIATINSISEKPPAADRPVEARLLFMRGIQKFLPLRAYP